MSGCVLRNFKSEPVAAELFPTLDVVEEMVDERGFEPPASSLRTRKNLSYGSVPQSLRFLRRP
jgi:hypothetical protein